MRLGISLALAAGLAAGLASAQDVASGDAPLSAIPWLTESLANPPPQPLPAEPAITTTAGIEVISITEIGGTLPDAVGLLPPSISGLAPDLWGPGTTADVVAALARDQGEMVPALQDLRKRLLLAELNPPVDGDPSGQLFQARVDHLLAIGALDEALALLDRAGPLTPALFPRYFDVALLTGVEDRACQGLKVTPSLQPTYPVRIFCQARTGDWQGAVLTLTTARAVGVTSELEDALLARFLDPDLFDGDELPPLPAQVTPLMFRLLDAVDTPLATTDLPRAFAFTDLEQTRGWKAQLDAAERLVRAGAIDPARLIALYTEQRPAASGGVWDRADALQKVEAALSDPTRLSAALETAWGQMNDAGLTHVLSVFINGRVMPEDLSGEAQRIVWKLAMLGPGYEAFALDHRAISREESLYVAIARGQGNGLGETPLESAVLAGFASRAVPERLKPLVDAGRKGEAILEAIAMVSAGRSGDHARLTEGLAGLRALGLESVARRAALETLILGLAG
jgi:hypothetical protein